MLSRIWIVVVATSFLAMILPAYGQQSRWAAADDPTAKYIVDMERKWAEGVCVDNRVVAGLLAEDFQGTSTSGTRFTKGDELKDEKSARTAHDCALDEAKVRFFGDSLAVSSTDANTRSARTNHSPAPRYARFGPTLG